MEPIKVIRAPAKVIVEPSKVEAGIIVDAFKSETAAEFAFNIKKSAFFKNGPPILSD